MTNLMVKQSRLSPFIISLAGSKYVANRYIAIAALASGTSTLKNCPDNNDIKAALQAITQLGAQVKRSGSRVSIQGILNYSPENSAAIDCSDSGTLARFITAVAANIEQQVVIDASEQMRTRPMQEIIDTLEELGVEVQSEQGYLPISLKGPLQGGLGRVDASRSSQFVSGLIIAALKAQKDTTIELLGTPVSQSYIEMTLKAISKFAGRVNKYKDNHNQYLIPAKQSLQAQDLIVPIDVVSASYFMAAALLAQTSVRITDYDFDSAQGESKFPQILELLGASIKQVSDDLVISYTKPLTSIDVDMSDQPDVVPTLAMLACFAEGTTHIRNIAHLAFKESDRIKDLCQQLIKLGAECSFTEDSISITGNKELVATQVSSCHDHRLAMSLALLGIRVPNIVIEDAQAVNKSFPDYWRYLEQIGIATEEINI